MTSAIDPKASMMSFRYSKKVGQYLRAFFDCLANEGIRYCVLHSYEGLPDYAPSDVDMAVDSCDLSHVEEIIFHVAELLDFRVIQKVHYDVPRCYAYVLFFRDEGNPGFIQLDLLNDDYGIGRYALRTKTLLEGRRQHETFFIPSVPMEACYLLVKKVQKGKALPEHTEKLRDLFREDENGVLNVVARHFGRRHTDEVTRFIEATSAEDQSAISKRLKRTLFVRYAILRPHLSLLKFLWLVKRVIERVVSPTGLIVVFLSPDGGGKSAVTDMILTRLKHGFQNTRRMHWRPYLLPPPRKLLHPSTWTEPEIPNRDPHALPPKSVSSSLLRFLYYLFDYLLGYLPKVLWPKIRTHLVIFERYYYDLLVDTKRFRLSIPAWLPRVFLRIVPREDILFLLTGPPEVLYERKQEISLAEMRRQLQTIEVISRKFANARKISFDQAVEDEVCQIEDVILDRLESRLRKRTGRNRRG
jgi:hypothetical protein